MAQSRLLIGAVALGGILLLAGCGDDDDQAAAKLADQNIPEAIQTDELAVDLVDGTSIAEFLDRYPELKKEDVRWNSEHSEDDALLLVKIKKADQAKLLEKLRKDDGVEFVENNFKVSVNPIVLNSRKHIPDDDPTPPRDSFPNDPHYEKQWNMQMIHAREAWRYSTGEDVIVAVIDTGVAYEDEKGIWAPDLDRTQFEGGWDFVNDDAIAADDNGHGTHCAGTIAQSTHNEKGVIGLARHAKIMPIKVLSWYGGGTVSDVADGIRYAADHGAHVISMSLGSALPSRHIQAAVEYAQDKGCLIVAAAGNANEAHVGYPAAYPGVIAVSSVGPSGERAFYSSYGKRIFMAAPGGDMSKDQKDGVLQNTIEPFKSDNKTVYAYYQGTSMATPHVAAAAALLYSAGVTRPDAIKSILAHTAKGDTWNEEYGHGVLDAGAAVTYAIFLPGFLGLFIVGLGAVVTFRRTQRADLSKALFLGGALMGSVGLFFLRPLGLAEVPVVGEFLTRGIPDWDIALFGASWHWTPIFASALIPGFLGLVSVKNRVARSLATGLVLGWAARLIAGIILPWADVLWVPGQGVLDALWLGTNAAILIGALAFFIRLGRSKDPNRLSYV